MNFTSNKKLKLTKFIRIKRLYRQTAETEKGNKIIIDIKTGKPPSSLDNEKSDQIKSYALLYSEENVEEGYVYFWVKKI